MCEKGQRTGKHAALQSEGHLMGKQESCGTHQVSLTAMMQCREGSLPTRLGVAHAQLRLNLSCGLGGLCVARTQCVPLGWLACMVPRSVHACIGRWEMSHLPNGPWLSWHQTGPCATSTPTWLRCGCCALSTMECWLQWWWCPGPWGILNEWVGWNLLENDMQRTGQSWGVVHLEVNCESTLWVTWALLPRPIDLFTNRRFLCPWQAEIRHLQPILVCLGGEAGPCDVSCGVEHF